MTDTVFSDRAAFVARFGGVFEHSPWIAEAAFDAGLPKAPPTAERLHACMVAALRAGTKEQQRALIAAHPDLAGRLARAGRLSPGIYWVRLSRGAAGVSRRFCVVR